MTKTELFDLVAAAGLWRDFTREDTPKLQRLTAVLRLAPGMTLLEPGCGTGRLTAALLKHVSPGGTIIANDISPRMIAIARQRRLGKSVRWHLKPVENVPLPPASIDRVICFQSFPHFHHKAAALRLFRAALKPDGLLAIVHFAGRRKINRIHRNAPYPIRRDLIPTPRRMETLLTAAGFLPNHIEDTPRGYWLLTYPA